MKWPGTADIHSDGFMAGTGVLVVEWPLVIGVDASGVVVEAGEEAESKYGLRPGTYVCGCTRLGMTEYAAGQEYFLMDAAVTVPKPTNIDTVQASTLGVGIETAALCIFEGLEVELVDPENLPTQKEEWAIVFGGASSVGSFAIQLLRASGYKVLASCSTRSAEAVKAFGAEVFDYKNSVEEQLEKVIELTNGDIIGIFDAVAGDDPVLAKELFKHESMKTKRKLFATTNDWSGIEDFEGGKSYKVELGPIGRPEADGLNQTLEKYIPVLVKLVENGTIKVGDYEVIGDGGVEDIVKAYKHKAQGASGPRKVVAKVQDE